MIGRLRGVLIEKQAPNVLLDVNGVGYELQAPMTTFFQLPELDQQALLHTHFSVSENAQQLFGFISKRDRELFRMLIKVSGVGPKMAVGIMSLEADDLVRCVMEDNVNALVKVPGVGKKTAERLIIELRDKLKSWTVSTGGSVSSSAQTVSRAAANTYLSEAESALVSLGYKPTEAAKAIARVNLDEFTSAEDLIRQALKSMLPS